MMFDLALKIFLLVAPIFYLPDTPLAQSQLQFFQYGVIFLFFVALSQRRQRDLKDKSLFLLALICFINVFIAETLYSQIALSNITFGFLLYYLIVCYTKNIFCLLKVIVILAMANGTLAIFQHFEMDIFQLSEPGLSPYGFMGISSHLADYQVIALPLALYFHPIVAGLVFVGILLAKSFTAYLALFVGAVVYLFRKRFSMVYFLAILSASVGFIIRFREAIISKGLLRIEIWKRAVDLIFEKPFQGWGFGSLHGFQEVFTIGNVADRLYNDYLEFGLCTGIIGVVVLINFMADKFKRYRGRNKNLLLDTVFTGCLIASVVSLTHSPMAPIFSGIGQSPRIAIVIITMFAVLEILLQKGVLNGTD